MRRIDKRYRYLLPAIKAIRAFVFGTYKTSKEFEPLRGYTGMEILEATTYVQVALHKEGKK